MLTREKVHQLVDHMPEKFSADDLIGEIVLLQKIEQAQEQIAKGNYLTEEEFDKEIDSWQ